jgi:D-inositol-3-phosphate glycosyltransferase
MLTQMIKSMKEKSKINENKKACLKFLFVLENYLPHIGGLETIFQNLMEGLVKQGHEVTLVTHRMKNTRKYEEIGGVIVYRVNSMQNRYIFTFSSILKTIQLAKGKDIIHTTTYNATFPAKIASLIRRIPCVITVHEVLGKDWSTLAGMSYLKGKIHQLLEKIILKLNFDKYVCVSYSTLRELKKATNLGSNPKRCVVVYNGVDYDFWDPKKYADKRIDLKKYIKNKYNSDPDFVYFFYGRPGISKGLEYLLKVVPLIKKKLPKSKLFAIVSKDRAYDAQYKQMLKLIDKLGIKDDVILHDPVPRNDLPYFIKGSDCVVIPSLTEGFGFNVAESCAMGTPVVASNTHSIPEVVSGRHLLVKPRSPQNIAEGVIRIWNKKWDIERKNKFTVEEMVTEYTRLYSQLL